MGKGHLWTSTGHMVIHWGAKTAWRYLTWNGMNQLKCFTFSILYFTGWFGLQHRKTDIMNRIFLLTLWCFLMFSHVFSCFLMFSHVFSCFLMVLDPFHHHFGWQKVWPIPPPLPGGFTAARQPGTVCSARWPISCAAMPTNIRAIASDAANICWTTRRRSHWISMGFLIWKLRKLRKPEWWVF